MKELAPDTWKPATKIAQGNAGTRPGQPSNYTLTLGHTRAQRRSTRAAAAAAVRYPPKLTPSSVVSLGAGWPIHSPGCAGQADGDARVRPPVAGRAG